MSGDHDVVNVHLGKPLYDRTRFKEFVKIVMEAADKAGVVGEISEEQAHRHRHQVEEDEISA
jgi:hypothetical protein